MHCNKPTFSTEEINGFLLFAGYEPGTKPYLAERLRRYEIVVEGSSEGTRWVERDDWDPSEPGVEIVYSEEEVAQIILRNEGCRPGGLDFWNTRSRLFSPHNAGDNLWVKKEFAHGGLSRAPSFDWNSEPVDVIG